MVSLRGITPRNFDEARPDIVVAIAESQLEVARKLNIDHSLMYLQPYCHNVTPNAIRRIKALGWAAVVDARHIPGVIYHEYVRFPGSGMGEDEIVADGTWGQFMPPGLVTTNEPRVLVGTRAQLTDTALRYGVPLLHAAVRCWANTSENIAAKRVSDIADYLDIAQLRAVLET